MWTNSYRLLPRKYALIKLPRPEGGPLLIDQEHADFGETPDTAFFVIRLKDKYAAPALAAYAGAAMRDNPEYALDVLNLAKAASESPFQKPPD